MSPMCPPSVATGCWRLTVKGDDATWYLSPRALWLRLMRISTGELRVSLPQNQELLDELANVRLKESSPGVYRMDHDPDKHDDQAIALALAANHLITQRPKRQWAVY